MTVKELMDQAKEHYERPRTRTPCLNAETGLDAIDCDNIDSLIIAPDYNAPIPNLHIFPKLKKLHISKQISLTAFEQMDLSSVEELYVIFEKKEPFIRFKLPKIKKLNVIISNNESDKLSPFDISEAIIDIRECIALEELCLKHCTDCSIKTDTLPKLNKLVCYDYKKYDFEILKFTPNLIHLSATGCDLGNIDFLELTPNLLYLDLSYNELKNVDKVFDLLNLQSLHIYRNPLDNPEKYKTLPCEVFVTEKDHDFHMFTSTIGACATSAYYLLKAARKPDPKRKPFLQRIYDRQTDEQIFVRALASIIKQKIEFHTSAEKNWRKNILLTAEELTGFVLQEYPFLMDFFETQKS